MIIFAIICTYNIMLKTITTGNNLNLHVLEITVQVRLFCRVLDINIKKNNGKSWIYTNDTVLVYYM